jgi:hypothetical protein
MLNAKNAIALGLFFTPLPLWAAPLDGFLTALPETYSDRPTVEVGYDMANDTVDVFNIRGDVAADVGDYAGAHVRVVWPVTPFLQLDGSLWKRGIDYRQDTIKLESWQVGAQQRISNQKGALPALALRVSAWGSRSDAVTKSSATLNGLTATQVSVEKPEDRQYQADVLMSWKLGDGWQIDTFGGVGRGKVKIGNVSVGTITGSRNGLSVSGANGVLNHSGTATLDTVTASKNSNTFTGTGVAVSNNLIRIDSLAFSEQTCADVSVSPGAASCVFNGNTIQLTGFLTGFGMDIDDLLALSNNIGFNYGQVEYGFNHGQLGFALSWHQDNWRLRGSYLFQKFKRDSGVVNTFDTVQTLTGEVAYRVGNGKAVFLRGQIMDHNLMGETPLAYNSLTASRFDKKYGLLTLGFVMGF